MRRWLAKYRRRPILQVIFNVRSPDDVILPTVATVSSHASGGKSCHSGRFCRGADLTTELLQRVPVWHHAHHHDLRPGALYGFLVEQGSESALGVTRFFKELIASRRWRKRQPGANSASYNQRRNFMPRR